MATIIREALKELGPQRCLWLSSTLQYTVVNGYVTLSREQSGHALSCRAMSASTVVT